MNIFTFRLVFFILALVASVGAFAQPVMSAPTATAITSTGATLGGTIAGAGITARGTSWKTSAGVVATDNQLAEGGTTAGTYTHARTGLPSGTQIFYVAYGTNGSGTAISSESSFYTLSAAPLSQPVSFGAAAVSSTQIDLSFTAANNAAIVAAGYVIYRFQGTSNPTITAVNLPNAAAAPALLPDGSTLITTTSNSATTFSDNTVTANNEYHYAIVPFGYNGSAAATYNYLITSYKTATSSTSLPTINSPTATSITNASATLGGTVTSNAFNAITERGTVWKTSAGATIADNKLAEGGTTVSTFSHSRSSLPAATQIFYKAYVTTAVGTALSSEGSFYTLAAPATGQPASFTAASASATSIDLTYSDPASVGAAGYIILRKQGSTPPDATGIVNAVDPAGNDTNLPGGTTRIATRLAGTTTYTDGSLTTGTQYSYTIIPFTFSAASTTTYNYLTSGVLLSDSDTPSNGVTISPLSGTVCQSGFSSIGNLVITESAKGDFAAGANRTLVLSFSGSGYIFEPNAALSATFTGGNNVTAVAAVADYSSVTITYSVTGTSKTDQITISGIKAQTSNSANPARNINRIAGGGSDGVIAGGSVGTTFGSITSSTPAVPSYSNTTGMYCKGDDLSIQTVTVSGTSIKWYSDATLTTHIAGLDGTNTPTLGTGAGTLGLSSTSSLTLYRYATTSSGCPVTVPFVINALPIADAGSDETVANGNTEVCSGASVNLGGTPTLQTPTASLSYSYAWTSTPSITIPSSTNSNTTINIPNATSGNISYAFKVTITDGNNCVGTDTKNVEVKPAIVPLLTQPNSTTFSTNTPPVDLAATPANGIFSGVGVVQTGPSAYKFSASSAYDNNQPLPQYYNLYYTVTSSGCTVTNYDFGPIMTLSNQLFSSVANEYCSSEHPVANGASPVILTASPTAYSSLISSVNYWNTTSRFYYGPLTVYSSTWSSLTSYTTGNKVRYNGEAYTALAASIGAAPSLNPALWQLDYPNTLKVKFQGTIRNYYEGYYGGNISTAGSTIQMKGSTYSVSGSPFFNEYEMLTNTNYKECPTCDYNYPALYIDFIIADDIQYLMPTWSATSNYYPGSVVLYGGSYYRILLTYNDSPYYSYGQDPTVYTGVWQSLGSDFDTGYRYKSGTQSGFYSLGQYVPIHKNPSVSFTGLASGLVNASEFCSSNTNYVLIGNANGTFDVGNFDMSYDGSSFGTKPGLIDGNPSAGQSTFNGSAAYLGNPAAGTTKDFYIRYQFDPGTKGSTGQACVGSVIQMIHVNKSPTVSFTAAPPDGQYFCFDNGLVDIQANVGTSTTTSTITLSGLGVTDLGNGTGKFDPASAFTQLSTATGLNYTYLTRPTINVAALITDANGCTGQANKPLIVNPLPPATVAPYTSNLCYTTTPFIIDGQQTNAYWKFDYPDLSHTDVFGSTSSPQSDINTFNAKQLFDNAVQVYGANSLATLNIDLTYTTFDPDFCLNSLPPVAVKIAPQIPVTIAGINDNEEFCSNLTPARQITLSPTGGTLSITRNATPIATPTITNDQFLFSPIPLSGGDYVFVYDVITGNNCSNPTTVNVKVLPSPIASFTAPPKCEGDVITFNADGSQNVNGVPVYTWTLEGGQVTGQNTSHQFSGVGTYTVNLNVNYPPAGTTNTVCSSNLSLDQYVGLIPVVDFDIADVCSGDATKFSYSSSITPIAQAQWDFGDGNTLPLGSVNQSVPASASTSGTYGNPIHSFASATTYTVTLTGRTSDLTGSCASTKTRSVSILEYLKTFGPLDPYSMKNLHNEDGLWVAEDKRNNSTWEFAAPNSTKISSPDKSWVTNAAGYYKSNDLSFVNSPCLDLSAYTRPSISVTYRYNTDPGKDGAVLQYSTDGGASWTRLGDLTSGLNWYNEEGISASPGGQNTFGWSGTDQKDWQEGKHSLNSVAGQTKVRFRVAFSSDEKDTLDGFAFNNVKIEERNRLTLVESFTNMNAAGEDINRTAFQNIPESEVVKIEYYTPAPGTDPTYLLNPSDFNSRAAYYGLTNSAASIPKGFIDGSSNGPLNSSWAISYRPLRSLVSAPLSIQIENPASINPDELTAKITLTALTDIPAGKQDLQIAIIEKQVGSDKYVLRKMLPSAAGTRLNLPMLKGTTVSFSETWSVKNVNSVNELAIVAFVQEQSSQDVLQAAQLNTLTNLPTVITGIGEIADLNTVTVYPNPADRDFTIQIPSSLRQGGSITLADQSGKVVHSSSFTAGSKTKTINTRDITAGLYILKLESGKETIHQKVVIVHQE